MRIFVTLVISLCILSLGAQGQTPNDQGAIRIMRSGSQLSRTGPAAHFTGSVRIDPSFHATAPARASGALVTFEPGRVPQVSILRPGKRSNLFEYLPFGHIPVRGDGSKDRIQRPDS